MNNHTTLVVEPFAEYRRIPFLQVCKHGKTMTVVWGEGSAGYPDFQLTLDSNTMNAELKAIWLRYKPQCYHRATFGRGGVHGALCYVPVDAGNEAVAVITKYFIKALQEISEHPRRWG
jgi:hypothetical protein